MSYAVYDIATNNVTEYVPTGTYAPGVSVRPGQFAINDPNVSGFLNVPIKYWKHLNDQILEMTQQEKDAVDAAEAAALLSAQRSQARTILDSLGGDGKVLRAVILLLIDELNALRTRDRDRAVDVAAATTLPDLKTRWAARSELSDRTTSQARTAIENKINAGDADS